MELSKVDAYRSKAIWLLPQRVDKSHPKIVGMFKMKRSKIVLVGVALAALL